MRALLFVMLFIGVLLVIGGVLLKGQQAGNGWQGLVAAGMALEAISIGLLLWKYVVKPQLRKA